MVSFFLHFLPLQKNTYWSCLLVTVCGLDWLHKIVKLLFPSIQITKSTHIYTASLNLLLSYLKIVFQSKNIEGEKRWYMTSLTGKILSIWEIIFSKFNMNRRHFLGKIQTLLIAGNHSFRGRPALICCGYLKDSYLLHCHHRSLSLHCITSSLQEICNRYWKSKWEETERKVMDGGGGVQKLR